MATKTKKVAPSKKIAKKVIVRNVVHNSIDPTQIDPLIANSVVRKATQAEMSITRRGCTDAEIQILNEHIGSLKPGETRLYPKRAKSYIVKIAHEKYSSQRFKISKSANKQSADSICVTRVF